ncbi:MAG: bifunctional phosphoribosylaminoimidazolecarboxamide formyltransferase/IMP cyclohydrolase, partial [Verrucomicrobiales bacterium]|nr:bifunctional phosphoribosylaminoimidazolecarboxamide formyltransferase/IMP cyclohydrolase [Verrucomicrobiales bacterium]
MAKVQRALLSVSDKTGVVALAQALAAAGVELISTGGTARMLREAGLAVTDISAFTGFPEMLDGRVKTLHPKVHGGLLFLRGHPEHEATARQHGIAPIDVVVVNLYPFEATVARAGGTLTEAIENIDIGGPALLRSAAKNHESVTVLTDPADYAEAARQITERGETTPEFRQRLAAKAFARTAAYDAAIARFFQQKFPDPEEVLPSSLLVAAPQVQRLRYGENPHQRAALYGRFAEHFRQRHGKELSYNNILDLTAAAALIGEFLQDAPTVAILKHTNPCGVGSGASLREAWEKAFATDRDAPFGGIIAVNRALDSEAAAAIAEIFSEVIVAPSFEPGALEVLQRKKNLRLVEMCRWPVAVDPWEVRSVGAESCLLPANDRRGAGAAPMKTHTQPRPTDPQP